MTELRQRRKRSGVIKKKHLVLERGSLPSNSLVCAICATNTCICAPELEQTLRANCTVNLAGDNRE